MAVCMEIHEMIMKRKKKDKLLSLEEHLKLVMLVTSREVDYEKLKEYGMKPNDSAKK